MALTDRSQRSRLSVVSTSDGGLTRVTDDSELMNASSEDFAVFQRRVRGYDPVLTYRQSDGASFKSAPGEDEEKCERWYKSIDSYPLKAAKSRSSKEFVNNSFLNTVAKTDRSFGDRSSLGGHVAARVSFLDDTASSSGTASKMLSLTDSSRKRDDTSRLSSETFSDASRTASSVSSSSFSRHDRSSTRLSSLSRTSTGTGSTGTSEQTSSTVPRRRRSHGHSRSRRKRPTTSDRSSASKSTIHAVSKQSGRKMLLKTEARNKETRRRAKAKGCCASLRNYWSDRKKRAQKEYRRKERKKLITVTAAQESILVKIRKYVGITNFLSFPLINKIMLQWCIGAPVRRAPILYDNNSK